MKKSIDDDNLTPAQEKFFTKLIFSKTKRKNFKNKLLRAERYVLTTDDFTKKPVSEEGYEERERNVWRLELSSGLLPLIELMKEIDELNNLTDCHFKLYKKEKAYIIANTYKNSGGGKLNKTFHLMPSGLPIKHRKREIKYRDKFNTKGFKLIDEGRFYQVFDAPRGSKISYKGKKYSFRIKYRQYYDTNKFKKYWIEMMRFKKLN